VMGGLVTALLLTLIVLPALYFLLETRQAQRAIDKTATGLT